MSLKSEWGPPQWKLIHIYARCLNDDTRDGYINYIYSLTETLPCGKCRDHWAKLLCIFPVELNVKNNKTAFAWSFVIHNEVNKSLGKPELTYDAAVRIYS